MREPSFDTWTIIFFLSAIQGIFLTAVLLFQRSKMRLPNRYLGIFVLLFSLTLLDYFTYWSDYRYLIPHFFGISFGFTLAFGPILYFYIASLNGEPPKLKIQVLHLIPAFLFYVLNSNYYLLPADEKILSFDEPGTTTLLAQLIVPIRMLHMLVYSYLAFRIIRSAKKANYPAMAIKWQKVMLSLFLLFIASTASYYILVQTIDFKVEYDYMISLSMAFAIYSIGYLGYKHPEILHGFTTIKNKYENSSLKEGQVEKLLEHLLALLKEDKVYRQKDLKLPDLAERIDTTPHHLSQLVNEQLQMTFPDLINSYRIEEAKNRLTSPEYGNHTIIEIAYDVGFNNKANFNNAFKKFTGVSPSQYRKENQYQLT